MILATDVKYSDIENSAKAVGVLFNWLDEKPIEIIVKPIICINQYEPGKFYKRELPCIRAILESVNLDEIEAIIVDGHVFIDNDKSFGLGGWVYKEYGESIPVIGVAKTPLFKNAETVKQTFRGNSKNPLYVSSIGIDLDYSSEKIEKMKGNYRIPTILKELDRLTKI